MKLPKKLLQAITVIIVMGILGYFTYKRILPEFGIFQKEDPEMTQKEETPDKSTISVQVGEVIRGDLVKRINGAGIASPYREIPIRSRTSGELLSVPVHEGQLLRKGSLLFVIDSAEKYAAFKESETSRIEASVQYIYDSGIMSNDSDRIVASDNTAIERFIEQSRNEWAEAEELLKSGRIEKQDYELRKQNFDIAQALSEQNSGILRLSKFGITRTFNNYERAKLDLENTKMYAPINGVVADLAIENGQQIGSGTEALKIIDDTKVRVKIGVLEPEVADLELGRPAKVTFSAFPGEEFSGYVETISPLIKNKTCDVSILVENPGRRIKTGMFAMAEIDAKIYKDRLMVPYEAVTPRSGRPVIFVVIEGMAKWNYCELGLFNNDYWEILSTEQDEIRPGDLVLTSGHINLGHDVPVKPVNTIKK
ncbi:efflux RND transporter periplasmic adaptor subunit [candidate division KSB1 bacterium]